MKIREVALRRATVLSCVLVSLAVAPVLAQSQGSAEQRQAILAYRLTKPLADKLLAALPEMTRYVMAKPNVKEILARSTTQSLAERIAQAEVDPGAAAILKTHGLTAREYVVGVPTLRMAIRRAQSGDAPGSDALVVSPDNLAFARANLAELKAKLDAAEGTAR
jgi:hypothetical protein